MFRGVSKPSVQKNGRLAEPALQKIEDDFRSFDENNLCLDGKHAGGSERVLNQTDTDWPNVLNSIYNAALESLGEEEEEPQLCQFSLERARLVMEKSEAVRYLPRSPNDVGLSKFKIYNTEAPLVTDVLQANGFQITEGHNWQLLWAGSNIRDSVYEGLHKHQRVNHFPGSTELTRKDRLWANVSAMQRMYGKEKFDFLPDTFVLPEQYDAFIRAYQKNTTQLLAEKRACKVSGETYKGPEPWMWIVKPNASSRGRGIFMLNGSDPKEVPDPDELCIVQRYISDPFLIQGLKFDLRIYVLVTSFDPLTIYVFKDGLTRFASSPFSTTDLDKYKHLTNYSINKHAGHYVKNRDETVDNVGHKWSLTALNKHLRYMGVSVN
eukprot:Cvel_24001.t2-p1 / transcript=Cvel_24001.t2 / gene=Cvel_24001 / organism=Chromera_velia_CCMP2878 / gene_product=Tubulin polyglutamylase TTLL5, putative / transcript_product=Tubulin polyglutamylase TTLL5, putative / location=Cvel_scaffold2544:13796-16197(+) / protein_length=378 / sequence_SO=supercontig / SO=protein_coding / is_pseudo=false